jgi:predicted HTH domain antitoxin
MPTISARLPEDEQRELDDVAALLSEDRSTTIRKALREGLSRLRHRVAAERYQSGGVSAIEAAELADCTVAEWLEVAHERNLTTQLEPADLELDAEIAGDL